MKRFTLQNENNDEFIFKDFDLFDLCELNELLSFGVAFPLNKSQLKQLTSYSNLFFISKGKFNGQEQIIEMPLKDFINSLDKSFNSVKTINLLNNEVISFFNEVWTEAHKEKKT
jgi:hypothetical protein